MKIYISGPMTGIPEFNYPAFEAAETLLREMGHEPMSPHRIKEIDPNWNDEWTWDDYMVAAIAMMVDCEAICMLKGWSGSQGARIELKGARNLKLKLFQLRDDELMDFTLVQYRE